MKNQAAFLPSGKAQLKVSDAPEPKAGPGEVVIKNAAVAVNPVDWKIQTYDFFIKEYPTILGTDVAGTVEEVGEGVTRIKKGDRVIAHGDCIGTGITSHAAYQHYTVAPEILTSPIPSSLSFTDAVVLPLAISTAAAGLFQSDFLALPYPTTSPKPSGKAILIWGGASSVGLTAVQLAHAAGVRIVATASKHNHELVKQAGADVVLDYNDTGVVEEIVAELKKEGKFAGAYDAISLPQTIKSSAEVIAKLGGGRIALVLPPPEGALPEGVQPCKVFAPTISTAMQEVGDAIWRKFVPEALAAGKLLTKPDPLVVGHGLEKVQLALDKQKEGVSAKKIVVTL